MDRLGSILIAATILAVIASAGAADRGAPAVVAQNPPEICTEIYQPVCGTDPNGVRKTYSNACFARMAKATDVTPGECPK